MFLKEFFHIDTTVYYLQELNEIPLNELFILESNSYFFQMNWTIIRNLIIPNMLCLNGLG
ncbi:hypothetical protein, partial [Photorhabdus sp. RM105S]